MIINRSFKDFKFRHRSKKNQIIYTSKNVKNDEEVINLINSFLSEENNIYLAKIKKFHNKKSNEDPSELKKYIEKQNSSAKNDLLKSYDLFLNDKYNVVLNQKTIERVKNFFQ